MMSDKDLVPVNFEKLGGLTKPQVRDMLAKLEAEMLKCEQIELPLKHSFSPGVYAREMHIPKGTVVMGKIHKFENMNILIKGELSLFSIDGGVQRIKAPYTVVSSPGVKRFAYAHEDSAWVTILGTEEKDVDVIESKFIAKTYAEVPGLLENEGELWLTQQQQP